MNFSTGETDSIIETNIIFNAADINNIWSATAMTMGGWNDSGWEEFLRKEKIKKKQKERRLKIKEIFSKNKRKILIK
jgi:hypothetical protein